MVTGLLAAGIFKAAEVVLYAFYGLAPPVHAPNAAILCPAYAALVWGWRR